MAKISELNVRLGLIPRDFDRTLARVERDLRNSGARMSRLGSDLTLAISAPLAAFGAGAVKAAGDTEALTLALEQQLGSAEAARKEFELLRKEALKPGLGLEQALKGSVALQAVGFDAETARKTLINFGNALALAGKGKAELDGVVLALTQISAKGKVSAEEINQIAERLPQIRTLMKQAFGTADTEALQKLGITSEQFIAAINRELEKLPAATGGIKNTIENVGDGINQFLAGIGQEINKAFDLKKVGEDIQRSLAGALEWFQRLDDGTKRMIVQFGLFAVAAGPVVKIFGTLYGGASQLIGTFRALNSAAAPMISFFTGMTQSTQSLTGYLGETSKGFLGVGSAAAKMRIGILAATGGLAAVVLGIAGAVYLLSERFDAAEFVTEQFNKAQKTTIEQAAKETAELNKNFDILRNVTTTTGERKKAISALQSAYPDYLKNIDLEKASATDLTSIQKRLNDEILRGVAERQKAAAVTASYEKQAQILLRIEQIRRTGETTTAENTLIDTGDMIRAGSRAAAIIEKLQMQVADLGKQADLTAKDFDKAFGLQSRAIDPLLEAQYDARQAAEDLRSDYSAMGGTVSETARKTREFAAATTSAGDGLTKKMKTALAGVTANLAAFDEKLKLYGPGAENAAKRNELLAASIDRLLSAGLPATSEQVQKLKDELLSSASVTDAMRVKYEALGSAAGASAGKAGQLAGATGAVGDALSAEVQTAIAEVTAQLASFDARVQEYGPTAENAEKRNDLLAKSIDRLLKAGFSATSDEVQKLKDELSASTAVTDAAKEAYRKLREEWSKPVSIETTAPIPTLPQANPLGVGGPPPTPEQAATPGAGISVGALNEGLTAVNALTLGLQNLVATGMTPAQAIMQGLKNDTLVFNEAFNAMSADISANGTAMQQIALGLGESFKQAADSGATSFSDFAREFIKSAAKIIRTQIQIAVTNAALSALQSTPYPYNLILAGIAGAAAGSLFQALVNKIAAPKLAGGGVIDRPTFALLGEYPGAGSNPEIAAPESKLRSIFRSEQGGGVAQEVYGIIRGSDIFISNQKAQRERGRVR